MLDLTTWQRLTLRVLDELHLDPKNVRLETPTTQVDADIVEDLFENENAFELVDAIAKIGYLTHEVPIAVRRGRKFVVVEGNRRLAALKAIQNPRIVPNHQARVAAAVRSMPKDRRDQLSSIEVLIAPTQEQANQIVAALHTSVLRRPWSPARQAAFFQAQIDAGRTYKQLVDRYPTIDVADFVLRARLIGRLRAAASQVPELEDFLKSREWRGSFSTLTRVFESRDFRDLTGITLDKSGQLATKLTDEQFSAVSMVILRGLQDRSMNTRSINTTKSPRFTQLVGELRETVRATADHEEPATESEVAARARRPGEQRGGERDTKNASDGSARTRIAEKQQHFLETQNVRAPGVFPAAIKLHLEELSIIDIQRLPNSTFLMLRALLEKSIKAYAEAKGVDIGKTRHTSKGGWVQLHNCLSWFVEHLETSGPKSLLQPAKRVQAGKLLYYPTSTDALNAMNHNHHFHVDPDEVVQAWNSIESLMRELMKP